jgi:hypothetical protein
MRASGLELELFPCLIWVSLESDKLSTLPCKRKQTTSLVMTVIVYQGDYHLTGLREISHLVFLLYRHKPTSVKIEYTYVKYFTHKAIYTNHTIFKSTKYVKKSVTHNWHETKGGSTQKIRS